MYRHIYKYYIWMHLFENLTLRWKNHKSPTYHCQILGQHDFAHERLKKMNFFQNIITLSSRGVFLKIFDVLKSWDHALSRLWIPNFADVDFLDGSAKVPRSRRLLQIMKFWSHSSIITSSSRGVFWKCLMFWKAEVYSFVLAKVLADVDFIDGSADTSIKPWCCVWHHTFPP